MNELRRWAEPTTDGAVALAGDGPISEEERILYHPTVVRRMQELAWEHQGAIMEARELRERLADRRTGAPRRQATSGEGDRDAIWNTHDNRKRKRGLYELWRKSTVLGTAVDVIAKRFVSGHWLLEPRSKYQGRQDKTSRDNKAHWLLLMEFLSYCNESEDFKQILYKSIIDLIVFGETYLEVVWKGPVPFELYTCDAVSMDYAGDGYGGVKYFTYGRPDAYKRLKRIDPQAIIRVWTADQQNPQRAWTPLENMINPLYSDNMMVRTQQKTFENMGSYGHIVYNLPVGSTREQARQLNVYFDEQFSGVNNARRDRVTFGGVTVQELKNSGLDADFLKGRNEARYESLGRLHVPPAMVSLIESGNIGGGTGEAQERAFLNNTVYFYGGLLMEKLTYQLAVRRFAIEDWVISIKYADFFGDPFQESAKTVNEKRRELELPPLPGCDVPIIMLTTRMLLPAVPAGDEPVMARARAMPGAVVPQGAKITDVGTEPASGGANATDAHGSGLTTIPGARPTKAPAK